jgi:uncharacterized membrane-anchored protein YhcB (DUF1043 family)
MKHIKLHCDSRLQQLEQQFLEYDRIQQLHNELDELEKVLAEGRNDVFVEWERISNMVDALAQDYFYINGLKDGRQLSERRF